MADTSAPAGTVLDLAPRWVEAPVTYRPSSSVTVQNSTGFKVQGINGTGTAPTVAATAGAGTGASVGSRVGWDVGGSFALTAGTTPAAGSIATVTFGTALAAAPVSVVVSAIDNAGTVINVGAGTFSATGFTIYGPALTATHVYLISYQVVSS